MNCFVGKVCSKVFLGFLIVSIMACGGGTSGTGGDNTSINLRLFEGTVVDSNQKPIPNVSVTVEETGDTTITDSEGKFEIASEVGQEAVIIFNGPSVNTSVAVNNLNDIRKPVQVDIVVDPATGATKPDSSNNADNSGSDRSPKVPEESEDINCLAVYKPVCATNGNTYGNSCEAKKEGATVAYEGECRQESNPAPICTQEFAPVCGADGETYGNRCYAISAGTTVLYEDECSGNQLQ